MNKSGIPHLRALDPHTHLLNAVIETPKGSRNKMKYDGKRNLFLLHSMLPTGAIFPFDFGFLPSTLAEDGDPLDILVLMEEPVWPGCLVPARLIGVIEAEQSETDGRRERNDRLVAVAAAAKIHDDVKSLADLNPAIIQQIEYFFVSYNAIKGKKFRPIGQGNPKQALALIDEAATRFHDAGDPLPA